MILHQNPTFNNQDGLAWARQQPPSSLDVILMRQVIHHIPRVGRPQGMHLSMLQGDQEELLSLIHRCLVPGGRLCVTKRGGY